MTYLRAAGKSTTIFHMINVRVHPSASILVTAVQNAAIQALLHKLLQSPKLSKQIVLHGAAFLHNATSAQYHMEHQFHRSDDNPADPALQQARLWAHGGRIAHVTEVGPGWTWLNLAWLALRAVQTTLQGARLLQPSQVWQPPFLTCCLASRRIDQ